MKKAQERNDVWAFCILGELTIKRDSGVLTFCLLADGPIRIRHNNVCLN